MLSVYPLKQRCCNNKRLLTWRKFFVKPPDNYLLIANNKWII